MSVAKLFEGRKPLCATPKQEPTNGSGIFKMLERVRQAEGEVVVDAIHFSDGLPSIRIQEDTTSASTLAPAKLYQSRKRYLESDVNGVPRDSSPGHNCK